MINFEATHTWIDFPYIGDGVEDIRRYDMELLSSLTRTNVTPLRWLMWIPN